jgi:hypothetical protein
VLWQYPKEVKVVFKNFPLPGHKFAMKAAIAALAAESQGKFWEFHDLLFKDYNRLNDEKVKEIAKKLGLDEQEFEKKTADPQSSRRSGDNKDGVAAGERDPHPLRQREAAQKPLAGRIQGDHRQRIGQGARGKTTLKSPEPA